MKKIKSVEWVAKDGSIFAKHPVNKINHDYDVKFSTQPAIAFNIGDSLATYLVDLHNRALKENHEGN